MEEYDDSNDIPTGVYFIPGQHSTTREGFAHALHTESNNAVMVSYERFCEAIGMMTGTKDADDAFRAAVNVMLEAGKAVVLLDIRTLDEADIALYGFDGPSEITSIHEEVKI